MWLVYCTPYKPWCWLTVVCYLQGMPDRMLCAVLEQFQLYFSLWYVRFVSIQNVSFLLVFLMSKQPVHFCFFIYLCIQTSKNIHIGGYGQVTSAHTLQFYSLIYWCLRVQYDDVKSCRMVSYWSCSYVDTLVLCFICATLCITVAIQQRNTCLILNYILHIWLFKSG